MIFKVLVDMKSCHGGSYTYKPGKWTPKRKPNCCKSGWHLTSDPLRWWKPRATLWLAEGDGAISGDNSDKAAFERVKLGIEVTKDWPLLVMFPGLRAFLAASLRSFDKDADIAWANLTWADLSGAYCPTNPPAGWVADEDGRLTKKSASARGTAKALLAELKEL